MTTNYEYILREEVYKDACSTAMMAAKLNVKDTQITNLLMLYESVGDPRESVKLLVVHVWRQAARKIIRPELCKMISDILNKYFNQIKDDATLDIVVKKYLSLLRWMFEVFIRFRENLPRVPACKDFQDFLKYLS